MPQSCDRLDGNLGLGAGIRPINNVGDHDLKFGLFGGKIRCASWRMKLRGLTGNGRIAMNKEQLDATGIKKVIRLQYFIVTLRNTFCICQMTHTRLTMVLGSTSKLPFLAFLCNPHVLWSVNGHVGGME